MNRIDLQGRVAVVTGGAGAIGSAICQRFAASGARVVVWDIDGDRAGALVDALPVGGVLARGGRGPEAGWHGHATVDVADEMAVELAALDTVARFGRIDALVCGAGIDGPSAPTWETPAADWKRVFDVNVTGAFLCCRAVVPRMLANDYGRIVTIASVAGKDGNPNASAFSAAKAAVIGLTKSLGKELAATGVRANCVTPAAVRTPPLDALAPQQIEFMRSRIPMGRLGHPAEIAAMIAWLASEECSFSTGAVFDASGGRAVY